MHACTHTNKQTHDNIHTKRQKKTLASNTQTHPHTNPHKDKHEPETKTTTKKEREKNNNKKRERERERKKKQLNVNKEKGKTINPPNVYATRRPIKHSNIYRDTRGYRNLRANVADQHCR